MINVYDLQLRLRNVRYNRGKNPVERKIQVSSTDKQELSQIGNDKIYQRLLIGSIFVMLTFVWWSRLGFDTLLKTEFLQALQVAEKL